MKPFKFSVSSTTHIRKPWARANHKFRFTECGQKFGVVVILPAECGRILQSVWCKISDDVISATTHFKVQPATDKG